jgi:hypothetical protein
LVIQSILQAFTHSQFCITLPLDVHLIFIKLFEQHILQRMEQLFLSIISILTNASDDRFIERLYSSCSAFGAKKLSQTSTEDLESRRVALALAADMISSAVETVFAAVWLPSIALFVESMVWTQWRAVMSVFGLNTGSESAQWKEVKHRALMLAAAV